MRVGSGVRHLPFKSLLERVPGMALKQGLFWPMYALYAVTAITLTFYLMYAPAPQGGRGVWWMIVGGLLLAPAWIVLLFLYYPILIHLGPPDVVLTFIIISSCLATPLFVAWLVSGRPGNRFHEKRLDAWMYSPGARLGHWYYRQRTRRPF